MPIKGPSILIVDDSRLARAAMAGVLQREGYQEILEAGNSAEAFEVLGLDGGNEQGGDVDLVLLDIVLPDTDGISACARIKADTRLRGIPVIMVTARDDESSLVQAFKAGAMDFINKPIKDVELIARVRSALALKLEMDRRKAREKDLQNMTRQLARANQELRRLSARDGLTGVANRRFYEEQLVKQWQHCARERVPISVLMIDIDFFKKYNDHYGHQQGDECLKKVASCLENNLNRPVDLLARYGGEEFVALLPYTGLEGALTVGEFLRQAVEDMGLEHAENAGGIVTVSVGAAGWLPTSESDPEQLVAAADRGLYRAKEAGRNRCMSSQTGA